MYTSGPYGDTSLSAADVIDAQGRYLVSEQNAVLVRQQVRQSQLVTRRRAFDEYLYERQSAPTWEDDRERIQAAELRRSRTEPPLNEIVSGKALNTLLAHLQKWDARGVRGVDISLDDDVLGRINVIAGRGGHLGLLKNGGRLAWPLALTDDAVRTERRHIDSLLPEMLAQAASRAVNADAINELTGAIDRLQQYVIRRARDLPPGQYVSAKRFLTDLDGAVKALQQPEAADYLAEKCVVRGKTVAELVRRMTGQGLRFAPAIAGDEAAYLAVHRALVAYEASTPTR